MEVKGELKRKILKKTQIKKKNYFQGLLLNGDIRSPIFDALNQTSDLENLHISTCFYSIENDILKCFQFLPKLTCLYLNLLEFTNEMLQTIFKNLLNLRELTLITHKAVSVFLKLLYSGLERLTVNCGC